MWHTYAITAENPRMAYVGRTNFLSRRWADHRAMRGSHGSKLYSTLLERGIEAFTFKMLDSFETLDAAAKGEVAAIAKYHAEGFEMLNGNLLPKTARQRAQSRRDRETPISVRPRKGSALEKYWFACGQDSGAMREIIYEWAKEYGPESRLKRLADEKGTER